MFNDVGRDEPLQQNFFRQRCKNLKKGDALAYDSTTISTYSDNQIDARYGFNKAHDGLKTIKQLTLYSIENRQPIAFTKEPGNLSDVCAIGKGISQLKALGIQVPEVVTDNGFYSESNLSDLLQSKMDFLMLIKTNITWVKPEVEKVMDSIMSFSNICPFDHSIYGTTVSVMHEFSKVRKYNSNKTGALKGSEEIFTKKLYLNIFFNRAKQNSDTINFNNDLYELKQQVEGGTPISDLKISAQKKVEKFFEIKKRGDKITLIPKDDAINEANKYHGYFVLVSNKEKNTFEALKKYRKRELIEEFFRAEKQQTDASRVRVWDSYSLRGRMFVQFVALCYYEYFNEKVRVLKEQLGKETGDPVHDSKANLNNEEKLKSWLKNTPLYLQLQWFDTVETVCVSSNVRKQRWSTGVTERDALYLRLLGVEPT